MSEPLSKLQAEFEKWDLLPLEIKAKCIKPTDFATRYNLRQSAPVERTLVDKLKDNFSFVLFSDGGIEAVNASGNFQFDENSKQTMCSLINILKTSKIQRLNLQISSRHPKLAGIMDKGIENGTIQVVAISANASTSTVVMLKKCWDKIDRLDFNPMTIDELQVIFRIPSVLSTRMVLLSSIGRYIKNGVQFVVSQWIENDVKFGTRLDIDCGSSVLDKTQTLEAFEDRKLAFFNSKLRIRTDNDSKNILMFIGGGGARFCCVVIRATSSEQQCETYVQGF